MGRINQRRVDVFAGIGKVIVVSRTIAWLLATTQFRFKLSNHRVLNQFAAIAVDRMGDVGIQLLRRVERAVAVE